jgi:hypothetical protein
LFPYRSLRLEAGLIKTTAVGYEPGVSNVPVKGPFGPALSRTVSEKVTGTTASLTHGQAGFVE